MVIFQKYAPFYNAFYEHKNYHVECAYIENIIQELTNEKNISFLDIGCGTGKHAHIFAKNDWQIFGIDTAEAMIVEAKKYETKKLVFRCTEFENANFKTQFNVITSLFAVVSYVTDNQELVEFFKSISKNLTPNGIFIFDVWFATGVLHLKPENRTKIVTFENKTITRKATSTHFSDKNLVEVCYNFEGKEIEKFEEKHLMRYFEIDELQTLLKNAGLDFIRAEGFMKPNQIPTKEDWNMTIIAKKV